MRSKGKVDHPRVVKLLPQIKEKERERDEAEEARKPVAECLKQEEIERLELEFSHKELAEEVRLLKHQLKTKPDVAEVGTQAPPVTEDASTEPTMIVGGSEELEGVMRRKAKRTLEGKGGGKEKEGAKDRT